MLKVAALFDDRAHWTRLLDRRCPQASSANDNEPDPPANPGSPLGQKLRYGAEAAVFFAFMGLFPRCSAWTPPRAWAAGSGATFFPCCRPTAWRAPIWPPPFRRKAGTERDAIRRAMWDNLGRVVGEYPHLGASSPHGRGPAHRLRACRTSVTVESAEEQAADVPVRPSRQLGDDADPGASDGLRRRRRGAAAQQSLCRRLGGAPAPHQRTPTP